MASFGLGNASGLSLGADCITVERPGKLHQLMLLTVADDSDPGVLRVLGPQAVLSCVLLRWEAEAEGEGGDVVYSRALQESTVGY